MTIAPEWHGHEEQPDACEGERGPAMQDNVPPPESVAAVEGRAEEERGKDEDHGPAEEADRKSDAGAPLDDDRRIESAKVATGTKAGDHRAATGAATSAKARTAQIARTTIGW